MRTKKLPPSGVVLLMVAALAVAGCPTVESTELMIEVRTKALHFAPDSEPADIDEIELRILRLVGSAGDPIDAGPRDSGLRDAGPPADAALDDGLLPDAGPDDAGPDDAGPDDAGADDAGAPADPDASVADGAVPTRDAGPRADAGAVVVPTRCPSRPATFTDGAYVFAEKWCGRYAIPRGARPPLTLGVVPADGEDSSAVLEFRATALLAGREIVTTRRLAAFVPHLLRRVPPLVLSAGCIGVVCPPEQTCNDDVCVPLETPSECLPAPGVDAGPAWASCGADGSIPLDAGPPDADVGPSCGDGSCNGGETCSSCVMDCGACPPVCGDGSCNGSETCSSCEGDCGACGPVCGDGSCSGGETCESCRDCQNGHLGTRPFMQACDASLIGYWRCVTSSSGPCAGARVSERCQSNGVWNIWSCMPANCNRCVCTGSLDAYCMDAP